MISEHTAPHTPTATLTFGTWHSGITRHLASIWTSLTGLTSDVEAWASVPALPYAVLWEASVVVGLVDGRELHASDAVASDRTWTWQSVARLPGGVCGVEIDDFNDVHWNKRT